MINNMGWKTNFLIILGIFIELKMISIKTVRYKKRNIIYLK